MASRGWICGWEAFKGGAEPGFHGDGVEVAADAYDELAADGAVVPGVEVGDGDSADGGELGLAGVGALGTVDELGSFAAGDFAFIVVAADDAGGGLLLGELELFRAEFGVEEQVHGEREDLIGVSFEGVPGDAGGV